MNSPRRDRLAGSFGWREPGELPVLTALLRGLGADAAFVDDVLGDLAEEWSRRAMAHGALAAGAWYAAEAMRALPHLAWNAVRHGGRTGRVRVAALVAGALAIPALVVVVTVIRLGAPVRLVVQGQNGAAHANEIIINSRRPVRLVSSAYDARGRLLSPDVVHYKVAAGDQVSLSADGVLTCSRAADARVLATAGATSAFLTVRCRPLKALRTFGWMKFVVGDSADDLPLAGVALDGGSESLLAGERYVVDTMIARLEGSRLRPLAAGSTVVVNHVGDKDSGTEVIVYEPVPTLDKLRSDQRYAIAPVGLAPHSSLHWSLPAGHFYLEYHGDTAAPTPRLRVTGKIICLPALAPGVTRTHCLARGAGSVLHVANLFGTLSTVGRVSIERWPARLDTMDQ